MPKKLRYVISSLMSALGFYLLLSLPYESHYYGLILGAVLVIFCFWFGLGIIFEEKLKVRLMTVFLPVGFFVGFGLFSSLLPSSSLSSLLLTGFFAVVIYVLFLVENVFVVSIGFRRVPLYRAAYTVGLIVTLLTSFFLFNGLFSYRLDFWVNTVLIFLVLVLVFLYQFWAITIELPDDGKQLNWVAYVLVPALVVGQLGLIFSFWPVGIFKGSIYLVSAIYLLLGLVEAEVRGRLFARTARTFVWIGVAIILAIVLVASWR